MSRRLKRALIVLAALLVASAAFLWALPEIVKWQAVKQIAAQTGRQVSIEDIDANLFTGRVAIKNFRLAEQDPSQTFVGFERLDVRVVPWSLVRRTIRVAELRLTAPTVNLVRLSPTEFNFSDILQRVAAAPASPHAPPTPRAAAPRSPQGPADRARSAVALGRRTRPVRADPGEHLGHRSRGEAGERVEDSRPDHRGRQPHHRSRGAARYAGRARRAQRVAGGVLRARHRPHAHLVQIGRAHA